MISGPGTGLGTQERRVAIITSQAFSLANFRGTLIGRLVADGAEVFAFAPDFDEATLSAVRACGAEPVAYRGERTGMNVIADLRSVVEIASLLRRKRIDTSLCYFIKPAIYGSLAAWLSGVERRVVMVEGLGRVFVREAGGRSFKRAILRCAVRLLFRISFRTAHRVIFLNEADLDDFSAWKIVRPGQADNIGGIGVDLTEWAVSPPVTEPVTFLLAARLLREKGVTEFVKAARIVKKRRPDTRFCLLGDRDTRPDAISADEIESWAASGVIEWPGHREMRSWHAVSSIFVLPSYYREGVPRGIQEAMATGRPIITTDVAGCRDTVVDGRNGFLIKPRDEKALADAMMRFVDQPELIETMGAESRKLAEERFDAASKDRAILRTLAFSG